MRIVFFIKVFIYMLLTSTPLFSNSIALVTLSIGKEYSDVVQAGVENKSAYCKKHQYDFICGTECLDPSRPYAWSKIPLILETMENSSYEWIFWSDADSLIMNVGISLEDLIDNDVNLILGEDVYAPFNTGQFFIRNCEWSKEFLLRLYAHSECINHMWWEQQAMIVELRQYPEHQKYIKILPQRLINSFPQELFKSYPKCGYKQGDFIIHFAGIHDQYLLKSLMEDYSKRVGDWPESPTLETYLESSGFNLSPLHSKINEGYLTEPQKKQFQEALRSYPTLSSILEIGFNAGHSSNNFFLTCPEIKKFVAFDINAHPYTDAAIEFFKYKYKQRFRFVEGDSLKKIPEYARKFPNEKFDLIYIDGNHQYLYCLSDIMNCRSLAHQDTIVWVDDYNGPEIQKAVTDAVSRRIIRVDAIHHSIDPFGERCWVEARYVF